MVSWHIYIYRKEQFDQYWVAKIIHQEDRGQAESVMSCINQSYRSRARPKVVDFHP